jgi:hypothetical protein
MNDNDITFYFKNLEIVQVCEANQKQLYFLLLLQEKFLLIARNVLLLMDLLVQIPIHLE